jgi:hypothetical protein
MTATTSNNKVNQVNFAWYAPGQTPGVNPPTFTSVDTTPADGFTSNQTISTKGIWTVDAAFSNSNGNFVWNDAGTKTYRVIILVEVTVNAVPELPIIGTAGAAIAMVGGLVYFKKK